MLFSAITIRRYGYHPFVLAYSLLVWLPYVAYLPKMPIKSSDLLILFPLMLYALSLVQTKGSLKPLFLRLPMFMFLFGGILSSLVAAQYPLANVNFRLQFIGNCIVPMCFFILLRISITEVKQLYPILGCLALGCVVVSLMPMLLVPAPPEHLLDINAGTGKRLGDWFCYEFPFSKHALSINPTNIGYVLSGAIPLLLGCMLESKRLPVILGFGLTLIAAVGLVFMSGSRAGMIGAFLGAFCILLSQGVRRNWRFILLLLSLLCSLYFFQSSDFFYSNPLFETKRVLMRVFTVIYGNPFTETSLTGRFSIWEAGFWEILTHPFGVGFRDSLLGLRDNYSLAAHNVFVNVGQGTGLVGLAGFIIIMVKQFIWLITSRLSGNRLEKQLKVVLLGGLIGYSFSAFTIDPTRNIYPFQVLWIVLAVTEVMIHLEERQGITNGQIAPNLHHHAVL